MRAALAEIGDPPRSIGQETGEDQAMLASLAAGDGTAFRIVVDRHLPMVLGVARRVLRDEAEADDVAQEALLRLWRNAATLELGPGGLRPWLRRVVTNLCIDRVRSARHLSVVADVPEQTEPPTQLDGMSGKDLSRRVELALKALPDRQRVALTLFHFEGLSQTEVGAALGVSDEAVESLLARGRRALKGALKDEWRDLLPDDWGTV
ncbi:MAG: sigma-70 family RNA polymerase sigma factor [Proteobacteria bacterium]|nr:sigma-70 family RNA polymerase sigma factor [Pseudomonadota bacterium]